MTIYEVHKLIKTHYFTKAVLKLHKQIKLEARYFIYLNNTKKITEMNLLMGWQAAGR